MEGLNRFLGGHNFGLLQVCFSKFVFFGLWVLFVVFWEVDCFLACFSSDLKSCFKFFVQVSQANPRKIVAVLKNSSKGSKQRLRHPHCHVSGYASPTAPTDADSPSAQVQKEAEREGALLLMIGLFQVLKNRMQQQHNNIHQQHQQHLILDPLLLPKVAGVIRLETSVVSKL